MYPALSKNPSPSSSIARIGCVWRSVFGVTFVIRGGIMLLAPDLILIAANFVDSQPQAIPIGGCVAALLGVWLTYTGYIAGMLRFDHPTR